MPAKPRLSIATAGLLLAGAFTMQAALAASPAASSSFFCGGETAFGSTTLTIPDAGRPGFVALVAQRGEALAFLSPHGGWVYSRMPFHSEYRIFESLPASFTFSYCLPEIYTDESGNERMVCAMTSRFSEGTILHATYGALTPEIMSQADARDTAIAAANQRLIALNREPRAFDRQRFIEAAVLRDARMKNPIVAGTVPFIDCTPPDTGGGGN